MFLKRIHHSGLSLTGMAFVLFACGPGVTSAATPNAIDAPRSARAAEAQQMLDAANGHYRQAASGIRADYKAHQAECDKLSGDEKRACSSDAKATRKRSLSGARQTLNKLTNDAYAKAPELRQDARPVQSQPEQQP